MVSAARGKALQHVVVPVNPERRWGGHVNEIEMVAGNLVTVSKPRLRRKKKNMRAADEKPQGL